MSRKEPSRAGPQDAELRSWPRWLGLSFLAFAAVLALWTVWLTYHLPSRHLSAHWDVAWGGFDVMLAFALAATGVAAIRGSPWLFGAAVSAATLLSVDAWFDMLTAFGHQQVMTAVLQAVFVEMPLAAACLYVATREKRNLSSTRPWLEPKDGGEV